MPEDFPVSKKLKVHYGMTIYKTEKWWSAVLFMGTFGRKQIAVYIWSKKGDEWKRWQKLVVSCKDSWKKISQALEEYIEQNKSLRALNFLANLDDKLG